MSPRAPRAFLIVFVWAAVAAFTGPKNAPLAAVVEESEKDEKRLWRWAAQEQAVLNKSRFLYADDGLNKYLEQIAKKLQPPEVWAAIPFKIRVIKDPHLNAFAFPNGAIYIHTGILARMDNEAQLAALLGHEMTHCTHKHALRRLRYVTNRALFFAGIEESEFESADLRALGGALGTLGSRISMSGYSQKLETEADLVGFELMANAGYDPGEALTLFEHLKRDVEAERLNEPFFFGSHPRLRNRIENCENFLKQNAEKNRHSIKNTPVFVRNTRELILQNAWLDLKAGRFRSAQRGAEKYLRLGQTEAMPYYLLGEILRQSGEDVDMKRAKAFYEKALALDPSHPDIYRAMGLIYYKEGNKTLAKKAFERCLSLEPQRQDEAYILAYLRKCGPVR